MSVHLAGVPVQEVLEFARLVDDEALDDRLETAYGRKTKAAAF